MMGLALLALGAVLLWAAFTGKADKVFTALSLDLQRQTQSTNNGGTVTITPGNGSAAHG